MIEELLTCAPKRRKKNTHSIESHRTSHAFTPRSRLERPVDDDIDNVWCLCGKALRRRECENRNFRLHHQFAKITFESEIRLLPTMCRAIISALSHKNLLILSPLPHTSPLSLSLSPFRSGMMSHTAYAIPLFGNNLQIFSSERTSNLYRQRNEKKKSPEYSLCVWLTPFSRPN